MKKSTSEILQILANLGRILSKVSMIAAIVGASLCLVGIFSLAIGIDQALRFAGLTLHGFIQAEAGVTTGQMYSGLVSGIFFCIGEAVVASFAARYFQNELAAGTPFTFAGADEMLRLGILCAAAPIAAAVLSGIAQGILALLFQDAALPGMDSGTPVIMGILFIVASLIFRYGAELTAAPRPAPITQSESVPQDGPAGPTV